MTKIKASALVVTTFALLALASQAAHAALFTCTVSGVAWQKYVTPATGSSTLPTDYFAISCTDGSGYVSYLGTQAQIELPASSTNGGCYASADALKAMTALATSARLAGRPLAIYYTMRTCPGSTSQQRLIDSVTLQ